MAPGSVHRMDWWLVIAIVVVLTLVAGIVHLLLTLADRRGLVWYRNPDRPPPRSLGMLEEIYQPSIEHTIEAEVTDETEADQAASGDPEHPGS